MSLVSLFFSTLAFIVLAAYTASRTSDYQQRIFNLENRLHSCEDKVENIDRKNHVLEHILGVEDANEN